VEELLLLVVDGMAAEMLALEVKGVIVLMSRLVLVLLGEVA
jgi:hypothetical protein